MRKTPAVLPRAQGCVLVALACLACSTACPTPGPADGGTIDAGPIDDGGTVDGGPIDGGDRDGGPVEWLDSLDDLEDVMLLQDEAGGIKYLLPVEGQTQPPIEGCAFQNTQLYAFHLLFINALPGGEDIGFADYIAFVLQRATRVWWGGEVAWRPQLLHPLTETPGVLVYTLYTEDSLGNRLEIDDVRAVHAGLTNCAPGFVDNLAFAPGSNEQRTAAAGFRETLADEGIGILE